MQTINRAPRIAGLIVALGTIFFTMRLDASNGDFYPSYTDPKVIGHLAMSGTAPRQMFLQQEGGRQYLYVQQSSQEGFTIFDVTNPTETKIVARVPQQNLSFLASGLAMAEKRGDSAARGARYAERPESFGGDGVGLSESVQLLDISDPAHPKTVQTFNRVTSILADDARGLTYVANGDGIWVVSHQQVMRTHECSSSDALSGDADCE